MQKRLFTWTIFAVLSSFTFTSLARADAVGDIPPQESTETLPPETNNSATQPTEVLSYAEIDEEEDDENPEGVPVTQSENQAEKAKKKEFWRNIIIAIAAVIVATVSILVVSNNNGK